MTDVQAKDFTFKCYKVWTINALWRRLPTRIRVIVALRKEPKLTDFQKYVSLLFELDHNYYSFMDVIDYFTLPKWKRFSFWFFKIFEILVAPVQATKATLWALLTVREFRRQAKNLSRSVTQHIL